MTLAALLLTVAAMSTPNPITTPTNTPTATPGLPNAAMTLSDAGLDRLKQRECPPPNHDYSLHAYDDGGGVWTIGCGHTDPSIGPNTVWTRDQCADALRKDTSTAGRAIATSVTVPLTQDQFDALVSFVFNVGVSAFKNSTLLKVLNKGQYEAVPAQMRQWVKSRDHTGALTVNTGLVNRRNSEIGQWTTGASVASNTVVPDPPPSLTANVKARVASATSAVVGSGAAIASAIQSTQATAQAQGGHWTTALYVAVGVAIVGAVAAHWFETKNGSDGST